MNSAQISRQSSKATTVLRPTNAKPIRHICYAKDQSNSFFNGPKFSKKVHDFFKEKKDLLEKHHTKQGNLVREWIDKEIAFAKEILECDESKENKEEDKEDDEDDEDSKDVVVDSKKSDDEFIVDGIVIETKQ